MTELRAYQSTIISERKRVIATGQRRVMIVAPTGAGKTVIGSAIIKTAVADGKRGLLAHTRKIIKQTYLKLSSQRIRRISASRA